MSNVITYEERIAIINDIKAVAYKLGKMAVITAFDGNDDYTDRFVNGIMYMRNICNHIGRNVDRFEDDCCMLRNQFDVVHALIDNYDTDSGNYCYIDAILTAVENCTGAFIGGIIA